MGFSRGLSLLTLAASAFLTSAKFLEFHTQADDCTKLQLEVPTSSLNKPFITHGIFNKATLIDGDIPELYQTRSWSVEDAYHVTFHLELSEDQQYLHYVREQYDVRTTDPEMETALHEGTWTGYVLKLPIIKSDDTTITVHGEDLLKKGFGIAYSGYLSNQYEIVLKETNSFEKNANIVVNYQADATYSIAFSLLQLPENQMKSRIADDRIGYFAETFTDLGVHGNLFHQDSANSHHQAKQIDSVRNIINRRRLEKDENGKVIKPITYYVDHSVPEIWRPYVKQGIEVWKAAFEKAGFPDGIRAVLPGDVNWPADYHVGDYRFDTISFSVFTGDGATAIGPSMVDPRSGEILVSNIVFSSTWPKVWLSGLETQSVHSPFPSAKPNKYRHRGSCVHHKMKQGVDQFNIARMSFGIEMAEDSQKKELVGKGFMDTTAHEVGHTLGLRHNFVGSLTYSPEQLKDTEFTKKNGIANTFMDYLPLNVWSDMTPEQIKDNTWYQQQVGAYDFSAIEYGYKELDGEVDGIKHPELFEIAAAAPAFATDDEADTEMGPFVRRFDLSSDPAQYFFDQMDVVKELRKTVFDVVQQDEAWTDAFTAEKRCLDALTQTTLALGLYIGGVKIDKSHCSPEHPVENAMEYISKEKQIQVMENMLRVATADTGLMPTSDEYHLYVSRMERDEVYAVQPADVDNLVNRYRAFAVQDIVNEAVLKRVASKGSAATLKIDEILDKVTQTLIPEFSKPENMPTSMTYVNTLVSLTESSDLRVAGYALNEVNKIQQLLGSPTSLQDASDAANTFLLKRKLRAALKQ